MQRYADIKQLLPFLTVGQFSTFYITTEYPINCRFFTYAEKLSPCLILQSNLFHRFNKQMSN